MKLSLKRADITSAKPGALVGWKAIADFFGCNIRTVRRWEQSHNLPVRRVPGSKGSSVFADASELDAWLVSREEEHAVNPGVPTIGAPIQLGDAPQSDSLLAEVSTRLPAIFANKRQVSQDSLRRWQLWRPWTFAASALLISFAAFFWTVKDHQDVFAKLIAQSQVSKGSKYVPSPEGEKLYLRGRYFWNLRTADGLAKAIDAYTQAIVKDPLYADAYAGLAESYDLLPQFGQAGLGESLKKAEAAADRAIALNPNLAEAHAAKAFALFFGDWNITGSDAEFQRALSLDPDSALIHQWYASTLECRDDGPATLREIDQAMRLNPTSPPTVTNAALFKAEFGDFDTGIRALKEIEQTQPTLATPAWFLMTLYFATGDFSAYIVEARRYASITHSRHDMALANAIARGWDQGGRIGLLEARQRVLKASCEQGASSNYNADDCWKIGETLLLLGRQKEARSWFRKALDLHCVELLIMEDCIWAKRLQRDPDYAPLFAEIHREVRGAPSHPSLVRVGVRLPE
jgi:tetratricopeptide (TPR) repeat protein